MSKEEKKTNDASNTPNQGESPIRFASRVLWNRISKKMGPKYFLILGIASLVIFAWIQLGYPGYSYVKEQVSNFFDTLPKGNPKKFNIAFANITKDDGKLKRQIIVGLEDIEELGGFEIVDFPVEVRSQDLLSTEKLTSEKKVAKSYLQEFGMDIFIWGERVGEKKVRLFWVTTTELDFKNSYLFAVDGECPPLIVEDLKAILYLLILPYYKDINTVGKYVVDRLTPFVTRLNSLLTNSTSFDQRKFVGLYFVLAGANNAIGEQSGDSSALAQAIKLYQFVAEEVAQTDRQNWAATQNNLAVTLRNLGELEAGTERFEEAVIACRNALEVYTPDQEPFDWAKTQTNLGNTLTRLGERTSNTARLEEAVLAFREALTRYERDKAPVYWAIAQNNLSNALREIGDREQDTIRLREALEASREALKELQQNDESVLWAMAQNNLGNGLASLGEIRNESKDLYEAANAIRSALRVYTKDRMPLSWALTQNNLGNVLASTSDMESRIERLEEAIVAYRSALDGVTFERSPWLWGIIKYNLGSALVMLGARKVESRHIRDGITALNESLKVRTKSHTPLDWALMKCELGNAQALLAEQESSVEYLAQAAGSYNEALAVFPRQFDPLKWALMQNNFGGIQMKLWMISRDTVWLYQALIAQCQALTELSGAGPFYQEVAFNAFENTLKEVMAAGLIDKLPSALGEHYLLFVRFSEETRKKKESSPK